MQQTNGSYYAPGTAAATTIPGFAVDPQSTTEQSNGSTKNKLVLDPNVPQLIALRFRNGKVVDSRFGDEKQVYFSLVDGRSAYLSLGVSQSINNLGLGDQEPFYICKRWNGQRSQQPRYDVWLTPEGEKARAKTEMQQAEQERLKLHQQSAPPRIPPASVPPAPPAMGTGTTGPAPAPAPRPMPAPSPSPAPAPAAEPTPGANLSAWQQGLLKQTNELIDVYAVACQHAEQQGVPNAVVRTVMLSAFIGLQRKGNY